MGRLGWGVVVGLAAGLSPSTGEPATTATTAAAQYGRPTIAVFSTVTSVEQAGVRPIDERRLQTLDDTLTTEARRRFEARGWRVHVPAGDAAACRKKSCYDPKTRDSGNRFWVASWVAERDDGSCELRAVLHDTQQNEQIRALTERAKPCSADNLLITGARLGRAIADGAGWSPLPTWSATALAPPPLAIADVPSVLPYTTSSTSGRRPLPLDEALAIYRAHHLYVVDDEGDPTRFYLVRGERLVNECQLRRLVQVPPKLYLPEPCDDPPCPPPRRIRVVVTPPPPPVAAFCERNNWEWALLGAPVGGLTMAASYSAMTEGRLEGVAFFSLGLIGGITTAVLALTLDEDAPDPRDGRHASGRPTLEALIARHNRALRESLGLSVADVHVARMRP